MCLMDYYRQQDQQQPYGEWIDLLEIVKVCMIEMKK